MRVTRLAIWLLSLAVFTMPALRVRAASGPESVLPAGAQVVRSVAVPGYQDRWATTYTVGGRTALAIVLRSGGKYRREWSHGLGGGTWTLSAPGPVGLLRGISSQLDTAGKRKAFAIRVGRVRVSSAIGGYRSGVVAGDRGLSLGAGTIVVRRRDTDHTGSLNYRVDTVYRWSGSVYAQGRARHLPDYAKGKGPRPNATIHTADGSVTMIRLLVADDAATRETGLMNRPSLDADTGMAFIWPEPVQDSFWMKDTLIPLSIAWIDSSRRIIDMQDMAPMTETLHTPPSPYVYAIEVNQGFFALHDVQVGDTVGFHFGT